MSWQIKFIPEAADDFEKLDGSIKILVRKALKKVAQNPLSIHEGGYGHPLSNHLETKLSGFFKIKLCASGIRIVYKLIKQDERMIIVVIGARADNAVYEMANKRIEKRHL